MEIRPFITGVWVVGFFSSSYAAILNVTELINMKFIKQLPLYE